MIDAQAERLRRLRRMQRFATLLLLAMAGLFAGARLLEPSYPFLAVVSAFAEAAMIGGLADWFAVTALFRHPLGLPIPHTAIVPSRKDEIGVALAHFIRDHFLTRETVALRVAQLDLAGRLGQWLADADHARRVGSDAGVAVDWLMRSLDGEQLRAALRSTLREALDQVPINVALATLVEVLLAGNHTRALMDQLAQFGRDQLERNRFHIRLRIRERSPWWLPRAVDKEIYEQLVGEFERILDDVGRDPDHPAKAQLEERLRTLAVSLRDDEELIRKGRAMWDSLLSHPAVHAYLEEIWARLRVFLRASLAERDSALRAGLDQELRRLGDTLHHDAAIAEDLNDWLRDVLVYLVDRYRDGLSEVISETVKQWDPTATARRIELHIGRDLQFIRVNGTLVGGLVGVAIHVLGTALSL